MDEKPKTYVTIAHDGTDTFEEKKSVFLCYSSHVKTEEEAMAFIREIRKKHADATHNVWAYVMEGGVKARYSDDGEPTGTAGLPALEAIRRTGVDDVAVVITRYFGGILLGAGGLARAYGKSASMAVEAGGIVTYEAFTEFTLSLSYPDYRRFPAEAERAGVTVDATDFADAVRINAATPSVLYDGFCARLREIYAGRVQAEKKGERFDCRR